MADTGIFCSGVQVARKAGDGANPLALSEAYTNDYISQAESTINAVTRHNWSDDYATLDVDVKHILTLVASNIAAMYVITYDMEGYVSRIAAEDLINVLRDGALQALSLLRDQKRKTFITEA